MIRPGEEGNWRRRTVVVIPPRGPLQVLLASNPGSLAYGELLELQQVTPSKTQFPHL